MEFYSAIKNYEIMALAGNWMDLENIMLNKPSSESQGSNVFSHMWKLEQIKGKKVAPEIPWK